MESWLDFRLKTMSLVAQIQLEASRLTLRVSTAIDAGVRPLRGHEDN